MHSCGILQTITAIQRRWRGEGLTVPPGISEARIIEFEYRHSVVVPDDMRAFYRIVNGMEDRSVSDESFVSLWPFESIGPVSDEWSEAEESLRLSDSCDYLARMSFEESRNFYLFGDHSIWLPAFAIKLSGKPDGKNAIFSIYQYAENQFYRTRASRFRSFGEFLRSYLDDEVFLRGFYRKQKRGRRCSVENPDTYDNHHVREIQKCQND